MLIALSITLIIPNLGKVSAKTEMNARKAKIGKWVSVIRDFKKDKHRLPSSLYEAFHLNYVGHIKASVFYIQPDDFKDLHDPNIFSEEIEYVFIPHRYGWYVLELKGGVLFRDRLMVDQDGRIYEIRELPQDN